MKRIIKGIVIAGVVLCILGAGTMAVGAAMGGGYALTGIFSHHDWWEDDFWENKNWENGSWDEQIFYENIQELEVDVFGTVIFEESDELEEGQVEIRRSGISDECRFSQKEEKLEIQWPGGKHERDGSASASTITIMVPADSCFKEIEIQTKAGAFRAKSIQAAKLSLKAEAGVIQVSGGKADELELEADAGKIVCHADVSYLVSAESDLGEINLFLEGKKEDFDYEMECSAGSIILEGEEREEFQGMHREKRIDNAGTKRAELESRAGTIVVSYEEEIPKDM